MTGGDYLSCDDFLDAVRSLAVFYKVEPDKILEVYERKWPEGLGKSACLDEFKDVRWVFLFGAILGVDIEYRDMDCCFYHRTRFDESNDWFEMGLLNGEVGTEFFLEKLRPFLAEYSWVDNVFTLIKGNVRDRNQGKRFMAGPYAYDTFADAAYLEGNNYDTPEFLMLGYGSGESCEELDIIRELCEKNFKSVIVKFFASPDCIDSYVMGLWFELYKTKFCFENDQPLSSNFRGNGDAIPFCKIQQVITNF